MLFQAGEYSASNCPFAESLVRSRANAASMAAAFQGAFWSLEARLPPFGRDFFQFGVFVLSLERWLSTMTKLENKSVNTSVCRDEHTTRCLDWRLWRLSGTAPDRYPVPRDS